MLPGTCICLVIAAFHRNQEFSLMRTGTCGGRRCWRLTCAGIVDVDGSVSSASSHRRRCSMGGFLRGG